MVGEASTQKVKESNGQSVTHPNIFAFTARKDELLGRWNADGKLWSAVKRHLTPQKGNTSRAILPLNAHTTYGGRVRDSSSYLLSLFPHHIMKLSAVALTLFLCVGSTTAQYFSMGWSPGHKASSDKPPAKAFAPPQASSSQTAAAAKNPSPNSLMDKLLTSSPVSALLSSLGVNVSAALNVKLWDERIQLITDDNYKDLIVNEQLTPEEEKERAWVLIMYACLSPVLSIVFLTRVSLQK